jgi:alanine racemase
VLDGLFTHLAVADELANDFTGEQLRRFDAVIADRPSLDGVTIHVANSAAALTRPDARRSLVRAGIAVYGISPFGRGTTRSGDRELDAALASLRPALALKARVSAVRRLDRGERLSYGLRHEMTAPAKVATVPIGYADGVRRNLSGTGATVLIGDRHRPIIGTITMDQLMVDCGDDDVAIGDEVVLIGRQGEEVIRAEDWAATLGTIGYEIVCGIGPRVPRRYIPTAEPL